MQYKKKIGDRGEELAVKFLKKKGYKIVGRNKQLSHKELDIIARKNDLYVFVEVKTRLDFGGSQTANPLGRRKIGFLKKAIKMYVVKHKLNPEKIRLDLICVDIDYKTFLANINHYPDIF